MGVKDGLCQEENVKECQRGLGFKEGMSMGDKEDLVSKRSWYQRGGVNGCQRGGVYGCQRVKCYSLMEFT